MIGTHRFGQLLASRISIVLVCVVFVEHGIQLRRIPAASNYETQSEKAYGTLLGAATVPESAMLASVLTHAYPSSAFQAAMMRAGP